MSLTNSLSYRLGSKEGENLYILSHRAQENNNNRFNKNHYRLYIKQKIVFFVHLIPS